MSVTPATTVEEAKTAIQAVLQCSPQLTMYELFERSMRLTGAVGNPDELCRKAGFQPDDIVCRGKNFKAVIGVAE